MGPARGGAQGTAAKPADGALPAKAEQGVAEGAAGAAQAGVAVKKSSDAEIGASAGKGQPDIEEDEDEDEDDEVAPEAQPSFPRNEVDKADSKVRLRAVHVYGLDFLKTGHMDEIFSQFKHKWIEWINDSSANIVFGDEAGAKKALESLSFPKAGDEPWRRTPDILVSEDVPPIFLQMRYATPADVKPSKKAVPKAAVPRQPTRPVQGRTKARPKEAEPPSGGNLLRGPSGLDRALEPEGPRAAGRGRGRGRGGAVAREPRGQRAAGTPQAFSEGVPATEEELSRRRRRAQRFGEPQAQGAAAAAGEQAREQEEETAKRIKRDARFGDASAAAPAPAKPAAEEAEGASGGKAA